MDIRMKKAGGLVATRQLKAAISDARMVIVTFCKETDLQEAVRMARAWVVKDNLPEICRIPVH
jgi:DNA-binding NarL/FixJ family response regulator